MLTIKKEEGKKKAEIERLNYTSCTLCSKKDQRGVGSVDRNANVAIRGANGRKNKEA